MKSYFLTLILALLVMISAAQQNENKSKRELRAEKKLALANSVDSLISAKEFTFIARSASPVGWSTFQLTSEYDLKISGDSVFVYLPFYGRAYQVDYMSTEGGIKFDGLYEEFQQSRKKKQYEIKFNAHTESDVYRFHLSVSPSGYASLSVISTNRQSISYNGFLDQLGI